MSPPREILFCQVCYVDLLHGNPKHRGQRRRSAAMALRVLDLNVLEERTAAVPVRLTYTPGLRTFHELPAIVAALR